MARFTVASLLALAGVVSAQTTGYHAITKPGLSEQVEAGKSYTITWTYAPAFPGNVVLGLIGGETQGGQVPLYTVGTADGSSGQLAWDVDCAYSGQPFYGLTITDASDATIFQYSTPFLIVDSDACSAPNTTSASASATVTATLSSVSSSSTGVSNTTTTCLTTSSYGHTTLAPHYNTTMSTSKTGAVVTSTSYSTAVPTTAAASSTSGVVTTSGATRLGGSIVMLAGVAAAFFVL